MKSAAELEKNLMSINRRSYPAYKDLRGSYQFQGYQLNIDHVQGDPFASPSKLSIQVKKIQARFPEEYYKEEHRRIALQDYLTRQFGKAVSKFIFQAKGSGKSGLIGISRCGQEVLDRTAFEIKDGDLLVRFEVGFPANGRTINAFELRKILFEYLPEIADRSLYYKNLNQQEVKKCIELAEDQHYIRRELTKRRLIAFVANGSILPRESGVSQKPMKGAIAFEAPESMEVEMELPHRGKIKGMGIPEGITLIVGGGYHGKSTLLKALEQGIYNHVAGDGREYVITSDTAMKIRAEDGRCVSHINISPFINDLPNHKDTHSFYSEDASGSTSQAANVIESMEAGTSLFLIDEDTSATNFMIRDELMQRVIHREMEPITPFIERIRELYEKQGISTVIVAGSSGAYFHIADTILQMDRYEPKDITGYAKKEAEAFPAISLSQEPARQPDFKRCPIANADLKGNDRIKMKTMGKEAVMINKEMIDLRYVEQIVDSEQVTALGYCMRYAQKHLMNGKKDLRQVIAEMEKVIEKESLDALCESRSSIACMAMPRAQEIFACFDRYRKLKL